MANLAALAMEPDNEGKRPERSSSKRLSAKRPLPSRPPRGLSSREDSEDEVMKGIRPTRSFPASAPSAAPIMYRGEAFLPPGVWLIHLLGLLGVVALILLGGGQNIYALSLSLLLPGISLILYPPRQGLGKFFDRAVLLFLGVLLFAFLPQFYWPGPEWRKEASELLEMDLAGVLSIQPLISFEAWISTLAGVAWFYCAISWPLNHNGRRWLYFAISIVFCFLSGLVLWGSLEGVRYPAAKLVNAFSFFPDHNQTGTILAIGGIVTFGFAMSNLHSKLLTPFLGAIASALCLAALVSGHSKSGLFLYFAGITICYLIQLKSGHATRGLKITFPLLIVAFCVVIASSSRLSEHFADLCTSPSSWADGNRGAIYADTVTMIKDAPISGHGLGNFNAIFPQYREASADFRPVSHPESGILWLASEGGLLALLAFVGLVIAYLRRCRGLVEGNSGFYRTIALLAAILFLLHSLLDVSTHRPGTAYFGILLAAYALPRLKGEDGAKVGGTLRWRFMGGGLVVIGLIWLFAGVSKLPLHSRVAIDLYEERVEEVIAAGDFENGALASENLLYWSPMNWRAHFQRGRSWLELGGESGEAELDFKRARFVEPALGQVTYEEGFAWLDYDVERTLSAWSETLTRELEDEDAAFYSMLTEAEENRELFSGMARVSAINPHFRATFLEYQKGDRLMRELERELAIDPQLSGFDREQRTSIVKNWIIRGDSGSAEAFLDENENQLNQVWWLRSLIWKNLALFDQASDSIRQNVEPPAAPFAQIEDEEQKLESLVRGFAVAPTDIMKGTALIRIYIEAEDFESALEVANAMTRSQEEVPPFVLYWKAEALYQLRDFIESWYTFETYLKSVSNEV